MKWLPHEDIVDLIRKAGNSLNLGLVTPRENSTIYKLSKVCEHTNVSNVLISMFFFLLYQSKSLKDLSPHSTTSSSSSGVSSSSNRSTNSSRSSHYGSMGSSILSQKEKRLSWNPFKKSLSRDRLKAESLTDCSSNVILR